MLVAFPERYRLYEHVKKTEKDGKTEVKSKTHAAGGNDRQDAYLYGHPEGRKKRYRSPADFFPHLLWLCTDESGDPENCTCKICSPDELNDAAQSTKTRVKRDADFKVTSGQVGVGMARQGSAQGMTKGKLESSTPAQVSRPPQSPRTLVPTPLGPLKSADQNIDRQYHTFMYRSGELVWFKRGQPWGLGAILRRWITSSNQYHYSIQPLSHPFNHPPSIVKSRDAEMRPWLAWSVPRYTNDGLNHMPEPPTYDNVDWQGVAQKRYGQGDMEVDASILSAKSVDSTYTLFSPNRTTEVEPGATETHYDGMYLGAEKFWVGDPLRLHPGSGTDVLVLHSIIERERTLAINQKVSQQSLQLVGDVYTLQVAPHTHPNVPTPASASNNPQLLQRLTRDLEFRNARSIPTQRVASYWKLSSARTTFELNDIKGRWYEASLLLPILNETMFNDSARKGEIQEATLWMNARGDCLNTNRPPSANKIARRNLKKKTRREAFGPSIPSSAEIRDGVDPPLPDNVDPALEGITSQSSAMEIDPRFHTADNNSSDEIRVTRPGDTGVEGGGIDEFMNLDGMEDSQNSIPGFGKEYGSQPYY